MKLYRTILYFCILLPFYCSLLTNTCFAFDHNIFGLHLTQVSDIDSAKDVINSSGGDWGWVTIVIRSDQLNRELWQNFFDKCRKYHLIPIIRLATIMENNYWQRPDNTQVDNMATFLDSLNWPTKKRHLILYNEINHASEWGGEVDIKNFTDMVIYTIDRYKSLNSDFFLLSSPLDLAAPEKPPQFKSAVNVFREINLYRPEYFQKIDALASHSYPNHGYIGTPYDSGQHSILGFEWELSYLKKIGVSRTLPVFITETGWPHREGESPDSQFYTANTSASFLVQAYQSWNQNQNILAVTPFIYNYPHPPFDHFSWLNTNQLLYPAYQKILDLPKKQNLPEQITRTEAINIHLPFLFFTNRDYLGKVTLKNTGQSIWGESEFCLKPQTTTNIILDAICLDNQKIYPGQSHSFTFKFKIIHPTSTNIQPNKSFISWESLPPYEITPFTGSATIYHRQGFILDKIKAIISNIFN